MAVLQALPNDSVRLGAESSLLYTDIIVQLEDGSLCDVEVQKLGYAFPSQRCACYSSDHLLRQYKRVRGERGDRFNYRDIKVYTIVLFEKSPAELRPYKDCWLHRFRQRSDSGVVMDFLQEFILIPLDIYRKSMENRPISTVLEAWLAFLSFTDPVRIEELIVRYPMFKDMYQQAYDLCFDTERVMNMFSKELAILDHNTVMYMVDEMQEELEQKKQVLEQLGQELEQKHQELEQKHQELEQKDQKLEQKDQELEQKDQELEQKHQELEQKDQELEQKDQELEQKDQKLEQKDQELEQKDQELEQKDQELEQKDQELEQKDQELERTKMDAARKDQEIAALKALLAAKKG